MPNVLQSYFPLIRTKEEILAEIHSKPDLLTVFSKWKSYQQEEFINFCCGNRGLKIMYDGFCKEVRGNSRRFRIPIFIVLKRYSIPA